MPGLGWLLRVVPQRVRASWNRRGVVARDTVVAVLFTALGFTSEITTPGVDLAELPDRPLDALGVLLVLAQGLPLVLRRRSPALCLLVVAAGFAAHQSLGYPMTFTSAGLLLAVYSVGAHLHPRWHRVATAAAATAAYVVMAVVLHTLGSPELLVEYLTFYLVLATFWAAGTWMRAYAAAQAEQLRLTEQAVVTAERARIARELHDVVTHHVTAMVVQADAAQYLTGQPDRVAGGLAAISDTGRHALTDLRYLLGALDGSRGPAETGREPAISELPALVHRTRETGQPVELVEDGRPQPMTDAAGLAAYRVVQESLTNAVKHAAGRRTVVRVRHDDRWMDVEVTTEGPARPGLGRGGGHGLIGLRERVSVVGGDLQAGARPDGGFAVRARIPLEMA